MEKHPKLSIYIAIFGVIISIVLVIMQALTPGSMLTGLAILFANTTILISNIKKHKKRISK